jgi:antitoxin YefM
MTTYTYTQTRKNLKNVFDETCDDAVAVKVVRRNGKNVVIISEDEYESMVETLYLNANPANRQHLEQSRQDYQDGKFTSFNSLADLQNAVGYTD